MGISSYSTNSNHFWIKTYCHRAPSVHGFPNSLILSLHISNEKCQAMSSESLGHQASKKEPTMPWNSLRIVYVCDTGDWTCGLTYARQMLYRWATPQPFPQCLRYGWRAAHWSFSTNEETQAVSMLDSQPFRSVSHHRQSWVFIFKKSQNKTNYLHFISTTPRVLLFAT